MRTASGYAHLAAAAFAALLILAAPATTLAHDLSAVAVRIEQSESQLRATARIILRDLDAITAMFQSIEPEEAAKLPEEVKLAAAARYLLDHMSIGPAGEACPAKLVSSGPDPADPNRLEFSYVYECPLGRGKLVFSHDFFRETEQAGSCILHYEVGREVQLLRVARKEPIEFEDRRLSLGERLASFIELGVEHIWLGFDHIAFLLALLLAALSLRDVLILATSFTIAHSITLLLAAMSLAEVPREFVEPVIALSIVYVGVENWWYTGGGRRWMLTFAFGLVHGLGFATMLAEKLDKTDSLVLPVVSFNLGVELGQIAIIAVLMPGLLALLRRLGKDRYHVTITRWGSVVVAVLGALWFIERVGGPKVLNF